MNFSIQGIYIIAITDDAIGRGIPFSIKYIGIITVAIAYIIPWEKYKDPKSIYFKVFIESISRIILSPPKVT